MKKITKNIYFIEDEKLDEKDLINLRLDYFLNNITENIDSIYEKKYMVFFLKNDIYNILSYLDINGIQYTFY